MKILKFGGTSVGSPERMTKLLDIINPAEKQIVVLSAVSGTTNSLVEISGKLLKEDKPAALTLINKLRLSYETFITELLPEGSFRMEGQEVVDYHFNFLAGLANDLFTSIEEKIVLAQGELISTTLFHIYLKTINVPSVLLPALDFMKIDEDHEPDVPFIGNHLQPLIDANPEQTLFITQGFICRNSFGEVDNLRRGGSDYTASLIG
jgi:aspartate kinase